MQAKNAAIQATVEATKAGETAKLMGSGQYLDSTVHHHHHAADGTTTVTTNDVTPIGTTITNSEPAVAVTKTINPLGAKVIKETTTTH